jgi:putative acetyltransferase
MQQRWLNGVLLRLVRLFAALRNQNVGSCSNGAFGMVKPRMMNSPSNSVVIRPFQPGDEDAFRRLNEEWITRYFRLEQKDAQVLGNPNAIINSGGSILMAVAEGVAIGCCALVPMGNGSFEVSKMAVTQSHQGQGIGRRLLTEVINEARRLGARRLYLETNSKLHPAISLYEAVGFRHMSAEEVTPSPYERADVYMEMVL